MAELLTILYIIFMTMWALALCVFLQKLTPFTGSWHPGAVLPRAVLFCLLASAIPAIFRHLNTWDTKPEETLFAFLLNALFWWVLWFHKNRLKKLNSYF
ncbi:MAG: hypothetical protein AAF478_03430 [Pseudomonadota bacterium]